MMSKGHKKQVEKTLRAMAESRGRTYIEGALDSHKAESSKLPDIADDRKIGALLAEYMKCPQLAAYQIIMCVAG